MIGPIERIQTEKNISLKDLSILLDTTTSSLQHMKTGTYKKISPSMLSKIKTLLGYDPDWIKREYREFRTHKRIKVMEKMLKGSDGE